MTKIIIGVCCFMLGVFVTCLVVVTWKAGTLKIDMRNHEKDIVRMEFNNIDLMYKRKYILFEVDRDADIS